METLLKIRIKNSGFKQTFLAAKIGISSEYFSMCINGQRTLKNDKQSQLKQLLKNFNA